MIRRLRIHLTRANAVDGMRVAILADEILLFSCQGTGHTQKVCGNFEEALTCVVHSRKHVVESIGIEPTTSGLQSPRSPN